MMPWRRCIHLPVSTVMGDRSAAASQFFLVIDHVLYDGKTQLLIENPINRYLINSADDPRDENERRFADTVHPEQISGRR
jgi:hypothetical protein